MGYVTFSYALLQRFCDDVFQKYGFSKEEAQTIRDSLLAADLYGIESHGMQRMVLYYEGIVKESIDPKAEMEVVFETPVTAVVDGHHGMGQLIATKSMELAIEKAKTSGIGIVSVRNSNHYGIAGHYAKMATKEGLIGFSSTNSIAIMVPTYGRQAMLGSNPIALAVPAEPYDFFCDASTSVVTLGKVEVYNKKGKELQEGWVIDENGNPSTDGPTVWDNIIANRGGGILPLGGNGEMTGSHKGYGYGMVCEIFSSILSLGTTSNHCSDEGKAGICHSFVAINPAYFGDPALIKDHFSAFLQELRETPKAEGATRVYTHGEKEAEAMADRMKNGIPVDEQTMVQVWDICKTFDIDFASYFGEYRPPVENSKFVIR